MPEFESPFCQVLDMTWAKLLNFFQLMFIYVQNGIKMKSRDFSGCLSDEDSTLYKKKKRLHAPNAGASGSFP